MDSHVALPSTIEIKANGKIVVAKKKLNNTRINFPRTISNSWEITFTYIQPLRISELRLSQENLRQTKTQALRFLAQPGQSYRIYFNPDRYVSLPVREAGNLSSNKDVLKLSPIPTYENPSYVLSDIDNDTIADIHDNCISTANTDQEDIDNNGRGDVCDDFDKDGLINVNDNCPDQPNRNQRDTDKDQIGDVCDDEESRLTEKYKWIPWVGMGVAALVLIILFAITAKGVMGKKEGDIDNVPPADGESPDSNH